MLASDIVTLHARVHSKVLGSDIVDQGRESDT